MSSAHGPSDKQLFILFGLLTAALALVIIVTSFVFVKRRRTQERLILEQRIEILRQQRNRLVSMENGRRKQRHLSADQIKALPRHAVADESEQPEVQNTCGICLADYCVGDQAIDLPCKHFFHERCLVPWLSIKDKCPYCNHELCAPEEPAEGEL